MEKVESQSRAITTASFHACKEKIFCLFWLGFLMYMPHYVKWYHMNSQVSDMNSWNISWQKKLCELLFLFLNVISCK